MKILYFTGSWCGPCRVMGPIIKQVAAIRNLDLSVYDVEDDAEIASQYGVLLLPTLIKMENGQEMQRITGAHSKYEIEKFLSAS